MALSRRTQVASGVLLLVWALIALAGSIAVLRMEMPRNQLLGRAVAALMAAGCLWVIWKAVMLIRGPGPAAARLLAPMTFRLAGLMFASYPLFIVFTGRLTSGAIAWRVLLNLGIAYAAFDAAAKAQRSAAHSSTFRIAVGGCDCTPPYHDPIQSGVCALIEALLVEWSPRLPRDLPAFPRQFVEERELDGRRLSLALAQFSSNDGTSLVVFRAFVHTWNRPTVIAIGQVGRAYAEGLLIAADGKVSRAPDQLMWEFR